jgi:glutathione S-transferase
MAFTIHGPGYSTYVRSVRLAFHEKGATYELAEVDMLKGETRQPAHLARHPFGMVPAFDHDGFDLYETGAILRYVDRVMPGPALQPTDPRSLARMDQMIGLIDAYGYPSILSKLVMQRLVVPMMGGTTDEAAIDAARPRIVTTLAELERLMGAGPMLVGGSLTLADLLLAPIFGYLTATPDAGALLAGQPNLRAWWAAVSVRPSMAATAPKLG